MVLVMTPEIMEQLLAAQQNQIEFLQAELALQRTESARREEELKAECQKLSHEILNLTETLRKYAGKLFGTSSESSKQKQLDGQMTLDFLNEMESLVDETITEPTLDEIITKPEPTKKTNRKSRGTREDILSKDLPVRKVYCGLSEEECICELCGAGMVEIGEEVVREELHIIPAKFERVLYVRKNYVCPECKKDDETIIRKALVPVGLLKHSLASPILVTYIIVQKYVNGVPLNRQSKDYLQYGVKLERSVLANWVNSCTLAYLKVIFDMLHRELVRREVLMSDETPCQVHHEEGKANTSKSYMWIHRTGNDGLPPIILYDYQPSRKGKCAVDFLEGFKGYHHSDGFSGYNKLTGVTRIACLAHIRRKFFDSAPKKNQKRTDKKLTPAEQGVLYCDKLFELERNFENLTAEERKNKRLEQSKPVLEAFFSWLGKQNPPSGSALAKAVTYALNQQEYMNNFLLDGRCSISNAMTENSVRPYTIIRKNSLFHDTPRGATASAIICSLIETAKAADLNASKYLYHLLSVMPGRKESEGVDDLLPWSDNIRELCKKTPIGKR